MNMFVHIKYDSTLISNTILLSMRTSMLKYPSPSPFAILLSRVMMHLYSRASRHLFVPDISRKTNAALKDGLSFYRRNETFIYFCMKAMKFRSTVKNIYL